MAKKYLKMALFLKVFFLMAKKNMEHFNLKMEGYEVLHFSGSQLFEKPLTCGIEVFQFIMNRVERWEKVNVGE